jgi:hypothetical protein
MTEPKSSVNHTAEGVIIHADSINLTGGDLQEQVAQPQVTVQAVNNAVEQAGEMKLTPKQQERKDKEEKKYWGGMITRSELAQILQEHSKDANERVQILYVQNATLLEVFKTKGLIVDQDMIDASKKVMEELFGIMPEEATTDEQN